MRQQRRGLHLTIALLFLSLYFVLLLLPRLWRIPGNLDKLLMSNDDKSNGGRSILEKLQVDASIDNLPQIRVDYGKYRPPIEQLEEGINSEHNEMPNFELANRCTTKGLYLGSEDIWRDCNAECKIGDEFAVRYRFVSADENFIVRGKKLQNGAYCLPTDAAQCHPNTTYTMYTASGWRCVVREPSLFSGYGGSTIRACNGRIADKATQLIYNDTIPLNLRFQDFREDRLDDNKTFRFECAIDRDDQLRSLVVADVDRFTPVVNWCTVNIPATSIADTVKPQFNADNIGNVCNCAATETKFAKNRSGQCTACKNYTTGNFETYIGDVPQQNNICYSLADDTETISFALAEYPFVQICGLTASETDMSAELLRPRCIETAFQIYFKPLPSRDTILMVK